MMRPGSVAPTAGACLPCLRRSWLLSRLGPLLDYRSSDLARLTDTLALDDADLLRALAGSRLAELTDEHRSFDADELPASEGVETICMHSPAWPLGHAGSCAPYALHVDGGSGRLGELLGRPAVAIAGTRRSSDYGTEISRGIARGLSASGVTVLAVATEGISSAALEGSLEATGACVAVHGGGLDVVAPALRPALEGLSVAGCVVSELPLGAEGRRWAPAATARVVVGAARVTLIVEAGDTARELAAAELARSLGRPLAAVPGRVTSAASQGTNELLRNGAALVRDAHDVLDLLHISPRGDGWAPADPLLQPDLAAVLRRVGAGADTAAKLLAERDDAGETLLALSELELRGLLGRGEAGRYVPRLP